jgi:predicted dehydrogenase
VLKKYTGVTTYSDFDRMIREVELDAVVIATPSRTHAGMVRTALEHDLDVFCEKPFTLNSNEADELTALARAKGLVTQVGYHNRFVGAFREVKRLLDAGAIGTVTHVRGEAYGPVVLQTRGRTWRSKREEGGGCLYDYAAHPIDLVNWYLGEPIGARGTVLRSIFSSSTEDEVLSTLYYPEGKTAQIAANWSDASNRKMTTSVTVWGTGGRIYANRQECQAYLRDEAPTPPGYSTGWNVRYTAELTEPVWFYLRGEEYSAQVDAFVQRVKNREPDGLNGFASATGTDRAIEMMIADAGHGPARRGGGAILDPAPPAGRRKVRRGGLIPRLRASALGVARRAGA